MKGILALVRFGLVPLVLVGSALGARADVWVVDKASGPGTDFTHIPDAVEAAADGDTILVREGVYSVFLVRIVGKGVSLVAEGDVLVSVGSIGFGERALEVRDLAPDQEVLIRGLRTDAGIGILDCDGAVWLEEVEVTGEVSCGLGGTAGAYVQGSPQVTFARCSLRGESNSDIWFAPHPSAVGLHAVVSTVQLYHCVVKGGWGQDSYTGQPLPGGAGIRIQQSTITVLGCTIEGGEGGLDTGDLCGGTHAPGGPGVRFPIGTGTLRSAESTAAGGVASLEPMCPGETGPQGPAVLGTGTLVALPGMARHLEANGPVRGGETLAFELEGVAGEVPLVFVSLAHEPLPLLSYAGILVVGLPPTDVFVLDPLPPGGQVTLSFPVPNLVGLEALTGYAQAVFLDPTPRIWLGAGTAIVLLDATF